MSKSYIFSDIHLSSRNSDKFMFDLFAKIREDLRKGQYANWIWVGDITEDKGGHNADLVNRIVAGFASLAEVCHGKIVAGNHDSRGDASQSFFKFLEHIPRIQFFTE